MKHIKPALTYEQQADLLLSRGLVSDRQQLIERLRAVGYYRLCAYWHPFKRPDDSFEPATTLDTVWQRDLQERSLRNPQPGALEAAHLAARLKSGTA